MQVIYSVRLGDTWNGDAEDKTGLISLQKLSRVREAKDGTLKEDCEEYAYFQEEEFTGRYDNPPDNTVIAGLNKSIWENSYVAEISKDAAETMSLEEITRLLHFGNNKHLYG